MQLFVDQVAKRNSPLPSRFTPQHGPSTFFLCVSIKGKGQCQEEGRTKKRSNLSSEKKCLTFEPMKKPVPGFVRFKVLELRIGTKPTVVVTSRPDEPDRRGWLDQTKRYRRVSIGMSFWELWLFLGTIRLYNYKLLLSLSLSLYISVCVCMLIFVYISILTCKTAATWPCISLLGFSRCQDRRRTFERFESWTKGEAEGCHKISGRFHDDILAILPAHWRMNVTYVCLCTNMIDSTVLEMIYSVTLGSD